MIKLIGEAGFVGSRLKSSIKNCQVLDKKLKGSGYIDITKPNTIEQKLSSEDQVKNIDTILEILKNSDLEKFSNFDIKKVVPEYNKAS